MTENGGVVITQEKARGLEKVAYQEMEFGTKTERILIPWSYFTLRLLGKVPSFVILQLYTDILSFLS
jgi:hypothetical protein